jgi:DNA-binding FadR family transcriptional regulator
MAVTEDAIERIKAMIVSGELEPGRRLPKEDELAGQLGLSRSSLREAVRALTAMKILVVRQGDGTYVSSLEPRLLLQGLAFAADVSRGETVLHLLQVRRMLEAGATGRAAGVVTDELLEELRHALARGAAAASVEEFVRHDVAFHRTIVDALANPVLSMLLEGLSTQTQRVRVLRGVDAAQAVADAQREHEAILFALQARDAELAAACAAAHVAGVERWVREHPDAVSDPVGALGVAAEDCGTLGG